MHVSAHSFSIPQYYDHPIISSLSPHGGLVTGATPVVVRGRGFRDFVPLGAVQRCAWGADEVSGTRQLTRARVLSDTRLECVSYLRGSPASVPFGSALNGLDFMEEASKAFGKLFGGKKE